MTELKRIIYKTLYELGGWWHKQYLRVTRHLSDDWCDRVRGLDGDRLRYWAQFRGAKLRGWKP